MPYTLFLTARNPRLAWLVVYLRLQTARISVKSNFALSILAGSVSQPQALQHAILGFPLSKAGNYSFAIEILKGGKPMMIAVVVVLDYVYRFNPF